MKRVALINDLSGLGRCSLTASLPVLSVMGVQPVALPTAVLTNQTGYPSFSVSDYRPVIADYIREWKRTDITFDGISTGFLTGEEQVGQIEEFLSAFRTEKTFLLVDPIMGDNGERYPGFSASLCDRIGGLARFATGITPNLTEACLLSGTDYMALTAHSSEEDYLDRVAEIGHRLCAGGPRFAVITGVGWRDTVADITVDNGAVTANVKPRIGGSYSGTGDLLAAVLCGGLCRGMQPSEAVLLASDFLHAALVDTVSAGTDRNDGVLFEPHLSMLL